MPEPGRNCTPEPCEVVEGVWHRPWFRPIGSGKHFGNNRTDSRAAYMAPEAQARTPGQKISWALADVFSFGALCVDILCVPTALPNMQATYLSDAKVRECHDFPWCFSHPARFRRTQSAHLKDARYQSRHWKP